MNLENEYLKPVEIESYHLKTIKELSEEQIIELSRIYRNLFNADNKNVIRELGIKGRTIEEGLWNENPYTLEDSVKIIREFFNESYATSILMGQDKGKEIVLGALVVLKRDLENMTSRGYIIDFQIPEGTEFWCEVEVFKREVMQDGNKVSGLTKLMRDKVIKEIHNSKPILLYSSSNNPYMVSAWKKDGFEVVEKMTTFGNKYQSYKIYI